ncbi:MAG: hypothetical protein M5U19_17725 [Microthrixaceae bacterium]|nr:hypothetical protein [Microthrixaceae bacterium]
MPRYLISFDDGAMDHIPRDEFPRGRAGGAPAVLDEAKAAGVWVFGGGLRTQRASIVAPDGTVTEGAHPETKGGIGWLLDRGSAFNEDALAWAAKFAVACRCAQEVRVLLDDPDV